jgi:hypothetical protein
MNLPHYFAEIIQSHLTSARAECWKWDSVPDFGSLVVIEQKDLRIIACVTSIETGSADPSRQPYAYQKTEVELLREQPQIFSFLKTYIQLTPVGFFTEKEPAIQYFLPPQPAKIHAFVRSVDTTLAQQFFTQTSFLYLLQHANPISYDEVLFALINRFYASGCLSTTTIQLLVDHYTMIAGSDYRRVRFFCERLSIMLGSD